ncbi:unnamed protein product [Dracunculus medinensis]|uniref:MFS domain-containing protein n=1 Tax=Dracunculus medinensis TaxID=318479 RepID=A0A158Q5T5_DRAME|nr:unnamed protein product [Dracunculus medinensis]
MLTIVTNFPSGFANSSMNTAVEELKNFINNSYEIRKWPLKESIQLAIRSTILNCWYIFQIFGALIAPTITERYGRKIAYTISTLAMLCASMIQYIATITKLPELLIIGRSLCAFFSPLSDIALILYLQECSLLNLRGTAGFFAEIGYSSMSLLGSFLGLRSVLGASLSKLLAASILPNILFVLFILTIPETPKYLMNVKNDYENAMKSVEFFYGKNDENAKNILNELIDTNENKKNEKEEKGNFKEIFTTWNLRQAVILATMVSILVMPIYPILQSSTYFFEEINVPEISSTTIMVILLVASIIGVSLIDRFSRRSVILISGAVSHIFLLFFVISLSLVHMLDWGKYVSILCLAGCCFSSGVAVGPTFWFIGPELTPQVHRSGVLCTQFLINNLMTVITNFSAVWLFQFTGGYIFIPVFTFPAIFALIYIYLYLPETKGREISNIIKSMHAKRLKANEIIESLYVVTG